MLYSSIDSYKNTTIEVCILPEDSNGLQLTTPLFADPAKDERLASRIYWCVKCAILQRGYEFPSGRIIVNILNIDLTNIEDIKDRLDVPVLCGILVATNQAKQPEKPLYGKLSLSGEVLPFVSNTDLVDFVF